MPNPSRWEANFPNRLDALMRAIEEMDRRLEAWGASHPARNLAQLAAEELGTNIIKYGYDDAGEHMIHLSLTAGEDLFELGLQDDGHEFNPCLSPEPDPNLSLEERVPGGWGLSLVRRLSAGMTYGRRENCNFVSVGVPCQLASLDPDSLDGPAA